MEQILELVIVTFTKEIFLMEPQLCCLEEELCVLEAYTSAEPIRPVQEECSKEHSKSQ